MKKHDYILTPDGELYHWKYTKREKVNGKWRYWYDDEEEADGQTSTSELGLGRNYRTQEEVAREKAEKAAAEAAQREAVSRAEEERIAKTTKLNSALNKMERAARIGERWISSNYNQRVIGWRYQSLDEARAYVDRMFPLLKDGAKKY